MQREGNRSRESGIRRAAAVALFAGIAVSTACMVGPKYQRPTAPTPAQYKEPPPAGWKEAQPNDGVIRGKWWEVYNDPQLNALEEQVNISNQSVLAAEAQFREAKDLVRIARTGLFPTVTTSPATTTSRANVANTQGGAGGVHTIYDLPFSLSYQADLWGSIRRTIGENANLAQASAAQLENARLTFQAEVASDYFQLHGLDGDTDLLERTVKSYEEYLVLTQNRYKGGVASGGDVAQAETQLDAARASLVDLEETRTQFEHAIAVLTGQPPSALTVPRVVLKTPPPRIPIGVPSTLLERRPDIANLERQMSAANQAIGIAQAAFYPALTLSAAAGLESTSFVSWFTWPSRFFSVGPQVAETLFDAGRRRAQVAQAKDAFDVTVATYRQGVLAAFQQVEDSLASLRVLENEAAVEAQAVDAAERSLAISTAQYKAGTTSYLTVITAQTAAFQAERAAIDILTRRLNASVLLIEALGGGWDASSLPTEQQLISGK